MGHTVVVEDEMGEEITSVGDPMSALHVLLAPIQNDQTFRMLNYIDWYGDTTFNRLQIPVLREELQRLATTGQSPEELRLLEQLIELTVKAEADVHRYVKFYGD